MTSHAPQSETRTTCAHDLITFGGAGPGRCQRCGADIPNEQTIHTAARLYVREVASLIEDASRRPPISLRHLLEDLAEAVLDRDAVKAIGRDVGIGSDHERSAMLARHDLAGIPVPAAVYRKIDEEIAGYIAVIVRQLEDDNGPSAVRADCARRALVRLRKRLGANAETNPLEETLRGYVEDPKTRSQGEVRSPAAQSIGPRLKDRDAKKLLYGGPCEAVAHLAALSRLVASVSAGDDCDEQIDLARDYLRDASQKVPREVELDGTLRMVLAREKRVVDAAKRVIAAASLRTDDPLATEHGELEHAIEES